MFSKKEEVESIGNPAGIGQGTGFGLRERDRDGIGLGYYRLRANNVYPVAHERKLFTWVWSGSCKTSERKLSFYHNDY